ncbi:conserved hypothetical protein [Uncinocarpus reesii 1704]|uniref:SMP-30/Gluconolactonase/LRE-like region domain-containing protein n=1 Tax=Uncinocarpus reesii (strain UAMH 1704) TaxID=336963 RepID=C4JGC0_UNCRE|nr:uncharacterized protein UREG_02518 [Uncinocarpus reesii 1704]EEP77669.1 conserved hypothetical protein [Uncinocarpus reesii 1704]
MSPEFQKWEAKEPYLNLQGTLLEGPFYDPGCKELRVTANIAGSSDNQIAVGAKHGYAILARDAGKSGTELTVRREKKGTLTSFPARMRANDGAVDSKGRFWLGMINDPKVAETKDEAVLFRLDPDLSLHRMVEHMTMPNGMGWNADETQMYLTDSPSKNIYVYDFDVEKGQLSNRRVFFTASGDAVPDGFAIDEEGCLWSAQYGSNKVIRISPEGKAIGEVSLPAKCVTCPEFVGTALFITTAKDSKAESDEFGGRLYKVDVGIRGKPKHNFILEGELQKAPLSERQGL